MSTRLRLLLLVAACLLLRDPASASVAATRSDVAGSNVNQTCLASNSSRQGATFVNDSSAVLYLKYGTTASATSYTVQLPAAGFHRVAFRYTGRIDCIWASSTGNARITEMQ